MSSTSQLKMTYRPVPVAPLPQQQNGLAKGIDEVVSALKASSVAASVLAVVKDQPGDPIVVIKGESILPVVQFLRDDERFLCTMLQTISAIDYLAIKAQAASGDTPAVPGREAKITVVYALSSLVHKHQVLLHVDLDRDHPQIDSLCDLYRAANWYEREVYDMFGVVFKNHPNLERILLPKDWVGHALRKDYVFPQEYNGMKVPL
jgi:NADH-quinone oxidoreductase subunit C